MIKTFFKVGLNTLLSTLIAGVLVFAPVAPMNVFGENIGQQAKENLTTSSKGFAGFFGLSLDQQKLPEVIGRALQIVLSILGLIFLILIVHGGILWMVAEGDKGKIEKARGLLFHAVLGLIITLSAYAITAFVLNSLTKPIAGS